MGPLSVLILYNQPVLGRDHDDWASEAGVLEALQAAQAALAAGGHRVRRLAVGASVGPLVEGLERASPDVVLNLCEGLGGTGAGESHVAGLLELSRLAYTGAGPECLALARDKARTKWLLIGGGLPTPAFDLVARDDPLPHDRFRAALGRGPLFVKPAREDASLGIGPESVVADMASLVQRIEHLRGRYGDVLVEQFVAGREFNAAVIALGEPRTLPLAEIEFGSPGRPGWQIVTYNAKWSPASADYEATPVCCPAQADPALASEIERLALAAFRLTNCRDYARVDLRVAADGGVWLLEVNPNPDLSPSAGLARAVAAAGIAYDDFLCRLVQHAYGARGRGATRLGAAARPGPASGDSSPASGAKPAGSFGLPAPSGQAGLRLRALLPEDPPLLVEVLGACGLFRPDEILVGAEILDLAAAAGPAGHYQVTVADADGRPVGWACHGLIPLSDAAFDLYWIAVHPQAQRAGVGSRLLEDVVARVRARGGRWLLAETSDAPAYAQTQAFYTKSGFAAISRIADFYRPGEGRLVFAQRLDEHAP